MKKKEGKKKIKKKRGKVTIGYIYCEGKGYGKDEKAFLKIAKKNNVNLIMFNISDELNEKDIEENLAKCNIIFNNSAEEIAKEFVKQFEEFGKRVIESSREANFPEDKWVFYIECEKNKIPTPETILLSENPASARDELEEFGKWPVVIKQVSGCRGEMVEKADNLKEADEIIKKFWEQSSDRIPLIAQEFCDSPCYRATVIGSSDFIQGSVKDGNRWKKTGVYEKKIERFKVNEELKKLIDKIMKVSGIKICGIDLLKKDGKWVVLEVNAQPAFDFFESQRDKLIDGVIKYLKAQVR